MANCRKRFSCQMTMTSSSTHKPLRISRHFLISSSFCWFLRTSFQKGVFKNPKNDKLLGVHERMKPEVYHFTDFFYPILIKSGKYLSVVRGSMKCAKAYFFPLFREFKRQTKKSAKPFKSTNLTNQRPVTKILTNAMQKMQ